MKENETKKKKTMKSPSTNVKKTKSNKTTKKTTSDVKKLKLLVTIVNRSKALFYLDILEQHEINMQLVMYGNGTASSEMLGYLGLAETEKAVIFSLIREDKVKGALSMLNDKFDKVRNGKGIAYTIPLSSIIGVSVYQFLSNNKTTRKEEK